MIVLESDETEVGETHHLVGHREIDAEEEWVGHEQEQDQEPWHHEEVGQGHLTIPKARLPPLGRDCPRIDARFSGDDAHDVLTLDDGVIGS